MKIDDDTKIYALVMLIGVIFVLGMLALIYQATGLL